MLTAWVLVVATTATASAPATVEPGTAARLPLSVAWLISDDLHACLRPDDVIAEVAARLRQPLPGPPAQIHIVDPADALAQLTVREALLSTSPWTLEIDLWRADSRSTQPHTIEASSCEGLARRLVWTLALALPPVLPRAPLAAYAVDDSVVPPAGDGRPPRVTVHLGGAVVVTGDPLVSGALAAGAAVAEWAPWAIEIQATWRAPMTRALRAPVTASRQTADLALGACPLSSDEVWPVTACAGIFGGYEFTTNDARTSNRSSLDYLLGAYVAVSVDVLRLGGLRLTPRLRANIPWTTAESIVRGTGTDVVGTVVTPRLSLDAGLGVQIDLAE